MAGTTKKKYILYHHPRCSKSRDVLDRLKKRGIEPKVVEYLKTPPSREELDRLCKALKLDPAKVARTSEQRFIDLELDKAPPKTRKGWIEVLATNPILLERPILTDGSSAVLGRPPEAVDKWLESK